MVSECLDFIMGEEGNRQGTMTFTRSMGDNFEISMFQHKSKSVIKDLKRTLIFDKKSWWYLKMISVKIS